MNRTPGFLPTRVRAAIVPLVACVVAAIGAAQASAETWENARGLHRIPVLYEGRSMPIESGAELILYRISGRRRNAGRSATEWLIRVLLDPFSMIENPLFLVDDPAALAAIGLFGRDRGRYSYQALHHYLETLNTFGVSLATVTRSLDATDRELLQLANSVNLFEGIASTLDVFRRDENDSAYERFLRGDELRESDLRDIPGMLRIVPVVDDETIWWLSPAGALAFIAHASSAGATETNEHVAPLLDAWYRLFLTHNFPELAVDPREALDDIDTILSDLRGDGHTLGPTGAELWHNTINPLRWAGVLAIVAAIVGLALHRSRRVVTATRPVIIGAVALLTVHQVLRLIITGRPPVTDLASSFVFVAWVIGVFGVAVTFGRSARARLGVLLVTVSTPFLLFFAVLVAGASDRFAVVQAVLDTNLWLATHVLVITSGYAAVIVAGIVAHVYLIQRIARPYRTDLHAVSFRTMHVVVIAGLALTFLGTFLGAVWADQSWGRFWGWDPKENGALLIILWISIALHGRITRWFDHIAYAALNVFGVVVVFFSWIGVNLMGVGLHSYGFSDFSLWLLIGVVFVETGFAISGWFLARAGNTTIGLRRAVVTGLEWDGDARLVTIATNGGAHDPGRYVGVRPEGFARAKPFSLVEYGDGTTRLLVKKSGPVSTFIVERLRLGESLRVSEAAGEFLFSSATGRDVVMLAGGIGVAPILGIARQALSKGHRTLVVRSSRRYLYGTATLRALADLFPTLRVVDFLSHPDARTPAIAGRLSIELFRPVVGDSGFGTGADWYVSGSPEFCDAARQIARAFDAADIHEERFTPLREPQKPPTVRSRVEFDGVSVVVLPGQTILDAALSAGLTVRHSCMSGSCAECACRVVRGRVIQSVDPTEAGVGELVCACVAHPAEASGVSLSTSNLTDAHDDKHPSS